MPEPMKSTSQNASLSSSVEQQWDVMAERFQEQCAAQTEDFSHLMEQIGGELTRYCNRRPRVVALGLVVLGFMVGWKLKP